MGPVGRLCAKVASPKKQNAFDCAARPQLIRHLINSSDAQHKKECQFKSRLVQITTGNSVPLRRSRYMVGIVFLTFFVLSLLTDILGPLWVVALYFETLRVPSIPTCQYIPTSQATW
jgi:hypothetical protein